MNAGVFQGRKQLTYVNDISQTINTNYVGLKILLDNLLPHLNGEHRFIFQGSLVAGWRNKKITTLKDKKLSPFQRYIISKSGVEALFYHCSKNNYPSFSFYMVEPGLTSTDIIRDFPAFIRWAGRIFLKVVSHSSDKAALTAMLALQSNIDKNTFIVPRSPGAVRGFPKIKKFPHKREREYLYNLFNEI